MTQSATAFQEQVGEAFKLYRDGDLLALSTSPLAHTELVECCFLTGEPKASDTRARILQSTLRWAVDRLRPSSEQDWMHPSWRAYNILHYFYIEGQRASELAEAMGVADQTLYQFRPQAITAAAQILHEELNNAQDFETRKTYALAQRYERHSPNQQQLLRIVAIFPSLVPISLIYQLAEELDMQINGENMSQSVQNLITAHLLRGQKSGTEVAAHEDMRAYLLTQLVPAARIRLHRAAGKYYEGQGNYLEAVRQLRDGEAFEAAAQIIWAYQQDVIDTLQVEELTALIQNFRALELSPSIWAQLKIVAGRLAEFNENIDAALEEYQQALGAPEIPIKAQAYYRRAKAFERKNIDESLAHYNYGIQLLEQAQQDVDEIQPEPTLSRLLVRMYIDRAWLFIQQRPDLRRAKEDLARAQALIDPCDRTTWSDLHNSLGEFYNRSGNAKESEQNYWQAWLAANEVQDAQRMSKTAHNLALVYMYDLAEYEQALDYLQRSRTLSRQTGDRNMEGLCAMSIGACYFWLEQFEDSVNSYVEGSEVFTEIGNRALLTRTYCGLAEAYAELNQQAAMHRYYQAGMVIAHELDDRGALQEFAALTEAYPQMTTEKTPMLNERQKMAIDLIRSQGQLTKREYQELTELSAKQAVRDLNELIELEVLVRVGSGRSTMYILND